MRFRFGGEELPYPEKLFSNECLSEILQGLLGNSVQFSLQGYLPLIEVDRSLSFELTNSRNIIDSLSRICCGMGDGCLTFIPRGSLVQLSCSEETRFLKLQSIVTFTVPIIRVTSQSLHVAFIELLNLFSLH